MPTTLPVWRSVLSAPCPGRDRPGAKRFGTRRGVRPGLRHWFT
jgi:hypothetical protein